MTVAQLVEKLKAMPQDLPIVVLDENGLEHLDTDPWVQHWCPLDDDLPLVCCIWNCSSRNHG